MKKNIIISIALLIPAAVSAQEVTIDTRLVSKYMWRGLEKGGVSVQPEACFRWNGLGANIFGSNSLTRDSYLNSANQFSQELDVSVGYALPLRIRHLKLRVNAGVTDYWDNGHVEENQYMLFDERSTGHRLEANIGAACRWFSLQAYTTVWGNDFKIGSGGRAWSTYIEVSAPFRLSGLDIRAAAGFTPMESGGFTNTVYYNDGTYGSRDDYLYADRPACVMFSLSCGREIQSRHFAIPLFVELHTNPYMMTASFVGGVGVRL